MIARFPFKTQARTIDHLGREQIADCPTAISELWKNAYDAYARNVSLNLYDDKIPVAVVCDDGHGMNQYEIINKWLVVGTESKATTEINNNDRNGLQKRIKQGQKGIGRLSCGYLGSLLLLVTRRKDESYTVCLIDWRLFENPFLTLNDIEIPVAEFANTNEILKAIPEFHENLMSNIWGDPNDVDRSKRIEQAWIQFELYEKNTLKKKKTTKELIETTIINMPFNETHFKEWHPWNDRLLSGTCLVIADIDYSLDALLSDHARDSIAKLTRDRFFETLAGFSDPFIEPSKNKSNEFNCTATVFSKNRQREIVGPNTQFSLKTVEHLEHIIKGYVDINGVFRGSVKAFGEWLDEEVIIETKDLIIPRRKDSQVGPFEIYIATMEFLPKNTSHTTEEFNHIKALAERYSGFMIYRDGLRVMPYGREDSDFFEIEQRRSKQAGREFWNHRQMFGRVAISNFENPNLRDKAGREGLVDNRASKAFKDIVENILMSSARRYFGINSDIRKKILPERQSDYKKLKAKESRRKLRVKRRKDFRKNLQLVNPILSIKLKKLDLIVEALKKDNMEEDEFFELRNELNEFKDELSNLILGEAPNKLGTLEKEYYIYKNNITTYRNQLIEAEERSSEVIEKVFPKKPAEIAKSDLNRNANFIHRRISVWNKKLNSLLKKESDRINDLVDQRNKAFHASMTPLIKEVENETISLNKALKLFDEEKTKQDRENEELFEPYIEALECLSESIDIQGLASFGNDEISELREELERLNALAQLGVTVEIVGHELATYDAMIGAGLRDLPDSTHNSKAYSKIKTAYDGLSEKLRFLTPLKLSGERLQKWIYGKEIKEYLMHFFKREFESDDIKFETTKKFEKSRIFDLPSRIYPVFLNLINNSIYWVLQTDTPHKILIDIVDGKVVIGDSGPGIKDHDISSLFSLFFTRKLRGGRGVGLYLCRANLAASGHTINYLQDEKEKLLPGANFVLNFKGFEYE